MQPSSEQSGGYYSPDGTAATSRTYFISIPITAITGHVTEEHLERLSLYMAIYGALFVLVGVVGIIFPIFFALAVEQIISWLLIFGGVFSLGQFFMMCGAPGTSSFLLLGVLHLAVGLWMLIKPIEGGNILIYVLSGWFLAHGLLKSLMACQVRTMTSWPAVLASGLLSIVLSFMMLALAPRYGLVLLGVIFGADLLVSGIAMLLIACMAYFGRRSPEIREPFLVGPTAIP